MKGQFITDCYIKYFLELPLLFKQQGSELSQLEDTHVLSIIYYQLFKLCGTSGQQQINQADRLGWRSGSFHNLLPQGTGQVLVGRNDSLVVMPHTSVLQR